MTVAVPDRSLAELMVEFESIGWNCEFGAVQRAFGAEPLGLLRFTGASIGNLIQVLESGFDDFLSADDFGFEVRGGDREFMVYSRRYRDFFAHTLAYVCRDDGATVFARELKKFTYLKRRFEQDWRSATRIYVHSGYNDEASILRLHAALRAKSNCALLWVVEARTSEERGRVDVRAPTLLKGHVAHYAIFDDGPRLDLQGWAMVCRSAEAILRGRPPPGPSVPRTIAAEFTWTGTFCGMLQAGAAMGHCRVVHATSHAVTVGRARIDVTIPAKSLVVFSVWVRLGASFRGRQARLTIDGASHVNHRRADLESTAWQQMWFVARIVEAKDVLDVTIEVEAARGSEFLFGGWQIEDGGLPDEGLRPSDAALFVPPAPLEIKPVASHRIRRWAARSLTRAGSLFHQPETSTAPSFNGLTGDAILKTADNLINERLFDEADGLLRAGMLLFPQMAELYTHYAFCAQSSRSYAEAAGRWRDVAGLFPQFALAHYRLAENLRKCGGIDDALVVVETMLPHHRDDPAMLAEAAHVYADLGRWPEAFAHWDEVFALGGDRLEWHEARALAVTAASRSGGTNKGPVPLG